MQASRVIRVAASTTLRAGNESPHLQKLWKSYAYTRNQRIQQLSPFEVDVLGPLFRDIGHKFKHKVEDNAFDVVPPLAFFMGLIYFVKWKRQDMMLHHRD